MSIPVVVVAGDTADQQRIGELVTTCGDFTITTCAPDTLPASVPQLYVVHLMTLDGTWAGAMEQIRGSEASANIPVVIISALPYAQLQSIPYAGDWTIAIVEEPIETKALSETINFLLSGQ